MKFIKTFATLIILLAISCGEAPKDKTNTPDESSMIEGFWKRTGMVQFVNGKAVDTLYYADGDLDPPGKDFIQMKAFLDGNIFWIMNNPSPNSPWKGSMGGYGKFKIEKDSITEFMSHATGDMALYLKDMKDEAKTSSVPFKFGYTLTEKNYVQMGGANEEGIAMAEYYEKMPSLPKSKIDGVWKRAYEIIYVNGVAVDTTSVPSDVILDIKVMKDGYFLYQVDRTKIDTDPTKRGFGGAGGFGEVEYSNDELREYIQYGSGNFVLDTTPRSWTWYHDMKFYDDDTFLQIGKNAPDLQGQRERTRGLIYRRIE